MDKSYRDKIIKIHGQAGREWVDSIPDLIDKYSNEWELQVKKPFNLSYNYVCPAVTKNDDKVVLKLCLPGDKEFLTEYEALRRFPPEVITKIIQSDLQNGATLLERAYPGTPISQISDDKEQIHLAAQVISKIHLPVSSDSASIFPTIADWAKAFQRYRDKYSIKTGPIPYKIFDQGEKIFLELLSDNKQQVHLHGDLHNDNILLSERGWLAIDPKGVIGERDFELGAYLRNPLFDLPKGSDYKNIQIRRIIQFADELGFDKHRIHQWSIACSVISLLWFLEDEEVFKGVYVENFNILSSLKV